MSPRLAPAPVTSASRTFYVHARVPTTYAQFAHRVRLRAHVVRPFRGGTVALWADNDPDFIVNLFAIWAAGAVPFLISRRLPVSMVADLLTSAEASALFCPDPHQCAVAAVPVLSSVCTPERDEQGDDAGEGADLDLGASDQEVALILHTSGTTSAPKLVRYTRANLNASLRCEREGWRGFRGPDDTSLGWLPLYHAFGLISDLLHCYRVGGRYVFAEANPQALLGLLGDRAVPPTLLYTVPWMLERLAEAPAGLEALRSLRAVVVAGAALDEAVAARLHGAGVVLVQQYGMTEMGAALLGAPGGADFRDMVPLLPAASLHLDQEGQLVVHGDCPTLGFNPGRDFPTRDWFTRTASGAYRYGGRLDDVLVHSSGEKTHAADVERRILRHLGHLAERAVVVGSGRLCAACILQWKHERAPSDEAALREALDRVNAELPAHSRLHPNLALCVPPEEAHRIPLTPKGTVMRRKAEEEFAAELERLYAGATPPGGVPARFAGMSGRAAREVLHGHVRGQVARVLGMADPRALDSGRGLAEQGIDSLLAVQLRTELERELGVALSPTVAFDHPSVERLVEHLLVDVLHLAEKHASSEVQGPVADDPIAIVGAACRFPGGADDLDGYWRLLVAGTVAVEDVPADRWDVAEWYDPDPDANGRTYVRRGSFVGNVGSFDAPFFRISPREAESLDPQQRLLLEVAWEALENAGLPAESLRYSRTGVFVGASLNEYAERQNPAAESAAYAATGSALGIAAGRLSYFFGLRGPSMVSDTACASSLTAVHLACQSLRNAECDRAVVGGVNLLLSPSSFVHLSRLRALSPDGQCKPFAALADGFGRGEGCAVIVLRRLTDAVRDGDRILGVIRATAVNHGGPSSGLTVPNGPAQQAVLREALRQAALPPEAVDFVECHGTGTKLGDPIEVHALAEVYGHDRPRDRPLLLGAVKANIGHLEPAAGLAGLLKVVLALQNAEVPGQPGLHALNPHIPWERLSVEAVLDRRPWPAGARPRIGGVSAFGLGGANAHVLVGEAPPVLRASSAPARSAELVMISTASADALGEAAKRLRDHVVAHPEDALGDVAFSLATTRSMLTHRLAMTVTTRDALLVMLDEVAAGGRPRGAARGRAGAEGARLAFLFSGQSSQVGGMGRGLYEAWPAFRAPFDRCAELFDRELDRPLREVIWAAPGSAEAALLDQTGYTQPALFALEYALAELWQSFGIVPALVAGHSLGELCAACVARVFSLPDAVRLVSSRSRLMQALPAGGAMVSIAAPEAQVAAAVAAAEAARAGRVSLAVSNGPERVVVAGDEDAVHAIAASFQARGAHTKRLVVSHAFHSPRMDPMLAELRRVAESVTYREPALPIMSNVSGALGGAEMATAEYWVRHVRETVRFSAGVRALHAAGAEIFVEVGPGAALLGLVPSCLGRDADAPATPALFASLRPGRDEVETLLEALGGVWASGGALSTSGVFPGGGRRLALPTYPWQRQRYWIESKRAAHPLMGHHLTLSVPPFAEAWEIEAQEPRPGFLSDHHVQGANIFPFCAYLEMANVAAKERLCKGLTVIANAHAHAALFLSARAPRVVQMVLTPESERCANLRIASRGARTAEEKGGLAWTEHFTARICTQEDPPPEPVPLELEAILRRCTEEVPGPEFYARMCERGNGWGPSFQGIEWLWRRDGEAVGKIRAPARIEAELERYEFHPALLDACGQVLAATQPIAGWRAQRGGAFVGGSKEEVRLYRRPGKGVLFAHARLRDGEAERASILVGDVEVRDESGELVAELRGSRLAYLEPRAESEISDRPEDWLYDLAWRPAPAVAHGSSASATWPPGAWVVFADSGGIGEALAEALAARGDSCRLVLRGDRFTQLDRWRFHVDPDRADDVFEVLRRPMQADGETELPLRIVYLFGADTCVPVEREWATDVRESEGLATEAAIARGCLGAVHLVRGLLRSGSGKPPPRLWLVTRGAQQAGSAHRAPMLAQAPLWGLGQALAQEHAHLWGGLVDLDPAAGADEAAAELLAILSSTRPAAHPPEDRFVCREGKRYVCRLVRHRAARRGTSPLRLRPDATYLITGGLGALGAHVARRLIARGARRLILMGRTTLPPRAEWRRLDPTSKQAALVEAVSALEALGASIHVASVDVGQEAELRHFVTTFAAEAWPPIRGVVHAAGTSRLTPLIDLDAAALSELFRSKVRGSLALHRLLRDTPLDFFVLFSSAAAVLDSPLLAGYAAANAFLDALAHARRASGQTALTINWGAWAGEGMATASGHYSEAGDGRAMGGAAWIPAESALDLFERLLAEDATQATVLRMPPEKWRLLAARSPLFTELADSAERAVGREPESNPEHPNRAVELLRALEPGPRRAGLTTYLRERVARLLGVGEDDVEPERSLHELGLDSLMAYELGRQIQRDLGVVLSIMAFLENATVGWLLEHVLLQWRVEGEGERPSSTESTATLGGAAFAEPVLALPVAHSFRSADDLLIYGHLSVPPRPGTHPAVVVHKADQGGALDAQGRYANVQEHAHFLAAGIAVLTVDQRGAPGHGEAYLRRAEIGGGDVDDIVAAAGYLSGLPGIDPQRIGFMGTSRGAYAGLLALCRAPSRFLGGVLCMGFYDPLAYVRHEQAVRPETSPILDILGDWHAVLAAMEAPSRQPLLGLRAVRTPLHLIHGAADRIVLPEHSHKLMAAARELGIPVSLEVVQGMGHDIHQHHPAWPTLWKTILHFFTNLFGG